MPKNNTKHKLDYKNAFRFLVKLMQPYRKWYIVASSISIFIAILEVTQTKISQVLIDSSIAGNINQILLSIAGFIGIAVLYTLTVYIRGICVAKLSSNAGKELKESVAHTLLYARYKDVSNVQLGDVIKTVNVDMQNICLFIENNLIDLLSQLVLAIAAAIYLIVVNPKLMFITFVYTPIGMFFTLSINKKMSHLYQLSADKGGSNISFIEQILSQIPVVKSFTIEKQMRQKLYEMCTNLGEIDKKISVWNALMQPACSSTSNIPRLIYLFYAGSLVANGQMSIGQLIAIFELLSFIIGPSVYFPFLMNGFNRAMASVNRVDKINKLHNFDIENKYNDNYKVVYDTVNSIELKGVSFSYNNTNYIINNLSFSCKGDGIAVICGKSGTGRQHCLI